MTHKKAIQPADRLNALQKFLDSVQAVDTIDTKRIDDNTFDVNGREYLVLTDEEARQATRENIRESLWAFKSSFIVDHSRLERVTFGTNRERFAKALAKMQMDLCEDANEIMFALIEDFDAFVSEAIKADGRGHFLSSYDSEEHEVKTNAGYFYIYRVN